MSVLDSVLYRKSIQRKAAEIESDHKVILVTGATGLIGSCIVDILLLANTEFNKCNTVYALGRSYDKLSHRFSYYIGDYLKYVEQDITSPLNIDDKIDYIIHGASNADPGAYARFPAETLLTNVYGAANVLNYCKEHKHCRMILLSTFEVYGLVDEKNEQKESNYGLIDYNMVRSCYPESKRSAEILARCFCEEYGVDAIIARLSSVYGPTMLKTDNKAHAQFIRNAIAGENIVLKSKGTQRRTYTYLMDAVGGIFYLLMHGKGNEAYNIANSDSIVTIANLAKTIAEIYGLKVIYEHPDEKEKKGYSVPQNCVLISDKIESIGWKPVYSLRAGLQETVDIMREMRKYNVGRT